MFDASILIQKSMKQFLFIAIILLCCSATVLIPAHPLTVVKLQNMQVFYIGVDNPVKIETEGFSPEEVRVTISGGGMSYTDRPGEYLVHVDAGSRSIINVAIPEGDTMRLVSSTEYRIKRVPDPVAYVNNIRGEGVVLKENIPTLTGVFARMENFDFNCTFTVEEFSMSVTQDGAWKEFKTSGPSLSAEMKSALRQLNEEEKVLFHGIRAKGPDGTIRLLNPVCITVK